VLCNKCREQTTAKKEKAKSKKALQAIDANPRNKKARLQPRNPTAQN
jgi:hypothetical protein